MRTCEPCCVRHSPPHTVPSPYTFVIPASRPRRVPRRKIGSTWSSCLRAEWRQGQWGVVEGSDMRNGRERGRNLGGVPGQRRRFLLGAMPRRSLAYSCLYTCLRGQRSPRRRRFQIVKRRRLRLTAALSADHGNRLRPSLQALSGVMVTAGAGDRIEIVYDLLQATAAQIEALLMEIGAQLGAG